MPNENDNGSALIPSSRQERAIAARDAIEVGATRPAALVPKNFIEAQAFCGALASSDLVPQKLKDRAADILVIVLSGIEVGLPPMQAIRLHHVINGVPRLSSDGMAAIVSASPACDYLECQESTELRSTWRTKKRGRGEQTLTWTIERAKRAGLLTGPQSKDRWSAYPEAMLNARCKSELCRLVYPEIVAGLYSTEEARDGFIDAESTETSRPTAPGFVAPPPVSTITMPSIAMPSAAPAPSAPTIVPDAPRRGRPPKVRDAAPPIDVESSEPHGFAVEPAAVTNPVRAIADSVGVAYRPPEPPAPPVVAVAPPVVVPSPHNGSAEPPDVSFGEDPADVVPEESIADFTAWLLSCKSRDELRSGRDRWIAWSRRRFPAGSPDAVAMQQAFARRNGELP